MSSIRENAVNVAATAFHGDFITKMQRRMKHTSIAFALIASSLLAACGGGSTGANTVPQ
jgi:hypothetical protein